MIGEMGEMVLYCGQIVPVSIENTARAKVHR